MHLFTPVQAQARFNQLLALVPLPAWPAFCVGLAGGGVGGAAFAGAGGADAADGRSTASAGCVVVCAGLAGGRVVVHWSSLRGKLADQGLGHGSSSSTGFLEDVLVESSERSSVRNSSAGMALSASRMDASC